MKTRRLTAKKSSITEICNGNYIKKSGFQSSYVLTGLGRKLSRVRIMGLIVDKFVRDDGNYGSVTVDDGKQTIRCKVFVNTKMFDNINPGDLVDVIGKVKEYNEEIYVMPEIIRKPEPNFETLRLLEIEEEHKNQKELIEKIKKLSTKDVNEVKKSLGDQADEDTIEGIIESGCLDKKEESTEIKPEVKTELPKDVVLKIIEENDGIDYMSIIEKSGLDENKVDQAVQELLEAGVCGEPTPGVIKKL